MSAINSMDRTAFFACKVGCMMMQHLHVMVRLAICNASLPGMNTWTVGIAAVNKGVMSTIGSTVFTKGDAFADMRNIAHHLGKGFLLLARLLHGVGFW